MRKVNIQNIADDAWQSPKGKFAGASKEISIALGRNRTSTNLLERHPFDVEICRIPPGKINCPFHSHSAQWEFYHVLSGNGELRHADGSIAIETGDAFIFEPGQPHQISNTGDRDLVVYIVADNPIGDSCYYPDSGKWSVHLPDDRIIRSEPLEYYDGEE